MSEYEIGLYRIIGEMIREKRIAKGFTLEQVAEKIGFIPKTLQRYETGERKIKISTIIELSRILSFDYDMFMAEAKARLVGDDTTYENNAVYFQDEETMRAAQEMFDDKDMKLLFDLKKTAKADDLMNYARFLHEQYRRENNL